MRASLAMVALATIVSGLALPAIGCASDDRVETIARLQQKTIDAKTADAEYGQPDFTTGAPQPPDTGVHAPQGLAIDPNSAFADRVYVADSGNHRFFGVESAGLSSHVAGSLFGQSTWSASAPDGGGSVDGAHLDGPTFVATWSGQWLVADTNNNRVLYGSEGSPSASWVFGQMGSFTTRVPNLGGIGSAGLAAPTGVAFLPSGRGYAIADTANHRVVVYSFTGTTATWVLGQADFTTNLPNHGGGPSIDGLNAPQGIARATPYDNSTGIPDPRINGLYVVDTNNHRVLHFLWTPGFEGGDFPSKTADAVWGQPSFSTGDPGVGADRLNAPTAIAIDPNNGFWVADTGNHRVLHFAYGSKTADKVIGQPDFDHGDAPTSTSSTSLSSPSGLAVAPNGDLFIADTGANRILKFSFDVGDSCDDGDPCTDDTLGALGCLHTLVQDSTACFPYECDVGQRKCATDCRTFARCQAPYLCFGSQCLKACSPGSTCEVGYCADGICCDAPCTGTCEACNVPGFEGTCHAFSGEPATFKSFARCESPTGDLECAGLCDGIHRDACTPTAKGTKCGATYCKEGVAARGGACDGSGSCVLDARDCFPYACGAAECRTSCNANDECADGAECASGICQSTSTAYVPVGGSCVASRSPFVRADRWVLIAIASLLAIARRRRRRAS